MNVKILKGGFLVIKKPGIHSLAIFYVHIAQSCSCHASDHFFPETVGQKPIPRFEGAYILKNGLESENKAKMQILLVLVELLFTGTVQFKTIQFKTTPQD